jgi:superfamily II DNA/RNA helicase
VCVAAPTGSGKTLTYVLPIVQRLALRVVVRLRALVVVPSRDLVSQVHDVFARFCGPLGLRVGSAHGQTSFRQEQDSLVDMHAPSLPGGTSKVDVLVCTPGRLMDHLQTTRGFTLQHLSFLVIDEADRLLAQHYNDWVHQVIRTHTHIHIHTHAHTHAHTGLVSRVRGRRAAPEGTHPAPRYTVVTLLSHCCHTVVTLFLHYCYTVVALLLH